jgi:hypothetical protein
MAMMISHSSSKTGCTESLPSLIKAILANDGVALISANVTDFLSFLCGLKSTTSQAV